ncbi:12938_t:CDS:2 [Entrophospora sp. SA101]|nr:15226_t:CDS:2 [Entrophospora sp. SA101]CAJ0747034.1 12938_t:CDS:2 [Entrophospora sp. SA101]CAJ0897673.1 4226_t:CDS:2 [Entrophospora sp. SA101]
MNEEYLRVCRLVLEKGQKKKDRTGTGTISYFGAKMEFDLKKGFPLLTTKKISFRLIGESLAEFVAKVKQDQIFAQKYGDLAQMALPPCHLLCQFEVSPDYHLSCLLYQRSGDLFLGVPFNIASYSLLTTMLAQVCGYQLGKFIHVIGDTHLYLNHLEQIQIQLVRQPKTLPRLELNPQITSLFGFNIEDIALKNYHP